MYLARVVGSPGGQCRAARLAALLFTILVTLLGDQPAGAAPTAPPPGSYEAQALEQALTRLGLDIDPAPSGKTLAHIHVVNLEVFGPRDGRFLGWFNFFHRTTRREHIAREVILRPGQLWDERKIDETSRKLRNPIFTTLVVIVPVRAQTPGTVDLLVVTRDVWSLRFNSSYEYQEGELTELSLSISENNLFGWRKHMALVFVMDQGKYFIGPYYDDKNLAGTRLQLKSYAGAIYGRDDNQFEGSWSRTVFEYPLWSLASRWGAAYEVRHFDAVHRDFQGAELREFDIATTAAREHLPREYRERTLQIEPRVTRSIGSELIQRFTAGYQLAFIRPALTEDFGGGEADRAAFIAGVLPRSERTSGIFMRYNLFTPRFVAYRDISTYDLSEDARLGPEVKAALGLSPEFLGSEYGHLSMSTSATYTADIAGDGYLRVGGGAAGRLQDGDLIDNQVDARIDLVAPRHWDRFRLVARLAIAARIDEAQNRFLTMGGRNGMRGYAINEFIGQRSVVGNVELRSMPIQLWFTRLGGLLFWDAGHAADSFADIRIHHNVGIGLRMLMPQLSPLAYRFDWAIATSGRGAGLPGRFTAGLAQVF